MRVRRRNATKNSKPGRTPKRNARRSGFQIERLEPRQLLSADPIINEILASNGGVIADEDGDYSDFIELYNQGTSTANLNGWYLTDSAGDLTKWQLPNVEIEPGGYLLVFASSKDRAVAGSELHTNFNLSIDGEYLALVQPDGSTIASAFDPDFPQQFRDISYGVSTVENETELVGAGSTAHVWIPTDGALGQGWTHPAFPDDAWVSGPAIVGYTGYEAPPPSTTVLQVDFNRRGSSPTQSFFQSFMMDGSSGDPQFGSVTRSYGSIDVTLTDVSGLGIDDRLRGVPSNNGGFTESDLLRDFVFSLDDAGTSGFDVTIDGLTPNEVYTFTMWSFDTTSTGLRTSNWSAGNLIASTEYSFDGAFHPQSNDTYRFSLVVGADEFGRVTLEGRKDEETNNYAVFLNALRIETGNTLDPAAGIDDVLRVDFNSRASTEQGAADTEPGYATMSLDENNATFGGVQVSIGTFGGASLNDRDRDLPVASGAFTLDQVYDDNIFASGPIGSGMEVVVSGLVPLATYDVILRSYDPEAGGLRQSLWTEISSGQTVELASPYSFDGDNAPTNNDQHAIRATLTASAQGTLVFRGTHLQAQRSVLLNGIELTRATYEDAIGVDVESSMLNQNSSIYVRVPFTVADVDNVDALLLDMRYDSGFVAYLNGLEVARRNAPTVAGVAPAFNAAATLERSVSEALYTETIDLTAFKALLLEGIENVLAIHAFNSAAGDDDFLIAPVLRSQQFLGDDFRYFTTPTPGAVNGSGYVDFVSAIDVSHDNGFYDASFPLVLDTTTPGVSIYYTYDGSIPAPDNPASMLYTGPIVVDRTTVFRARGYRDDFGPSYVTTQTFVFLDDVINQSIDPNNPANNPFGLDYPAIWQANAPGDFNMDPSVVSQWDDNNPANTDFGIREALTSIPTMSIVMDHDDLWNGSSGIYPNATSQGDAWRRAGSLEYFNSDLADDFQFNVGVQMHGGASRDNVRLKKHSFRIAFSGEYDGPGTLQVPIFEGSEFADMNTIVLKAAFTDSFATRTATNRYSPLDSTYTRDVWMLDAQRAMGSLSPNATYVHLYINGLYWGMYYVAERADDAFLASHLGGEREDWDVVKDFNELFRGTKDAWNEMFDVARQLENANSNEANAIYWQLQGRNPDGSVNPSGTTYLDVENLIDYMVLHIYGGVEDWPSHNWVAARNRVEPGKGFQFFTWDQEISFDGRFRDRTEASNSYTPAELYSLLRNSAEFRLHFADRVQKHLFNDGALTVENSVERWLDRANQVEAAIIGESARWGDAREGEVVNVPPQSVVPTMTVDHWRANVAQVVGYIPQSRSLAISRLTSDGLFGSLAAPQFSSYGGQVELGHQVTLTKPVGSPVSAQIYYTLDGSDPRLPGGALSGSAIPYTGPITIDSAVVPINARILNFSGWSPVVETTFSANVPGGIFVYNGGVYDQDFDGLPTAGEETLTGRGPHEIGGVLGAADLVGWTMSNFGGSSSNTEFRAQDGSESGGDGRGVVSFGSTAASDRALGALATSNQISRFGISYLNNSGETLTQFTVEYVGEQWRRGELPIPNSLYFAYAVGETDINADGSFVAVPQLTFSSPNSQSSPQEVALDGNAEGNRTLITFTVTGLDWEPGEVLTLRWTGEDLQGQDDGLAIDDLTFIAEAVATTPGDFNGDGNVDGADFVIWQTNFPNNSGSAILATGDANGDGNVDGADFVVWQTNFPTTSGGATPAPASAVAATPEPAPSYSSGNSDGESGNSKDGSGVATASPTSDAPQPASSSPAPAAAASKTTEPEGESTEPAATGGSDSNDGHLASKPAAATPAAASLPRSTPDILVKSSIGPAVASIDVGHILSVTSSRLAARAVPVSPAVEVARATVDAVFLGQFDPDFVGPRERPMLFARGGARFADVAPRSVYDEEIEAIVPAAVDWWLEQSTLEPSRPDDELQTASNQNDLADVYLVDWLSVRT